MRVYICGCVKECEQYLEAVFENIRRITPLFEDYRVVMAYDYSPRDKTLKKLCDMKQQYFGHRMNILINRKPCSSQRVENICNARNEMLRYMRNHRTGRDASNNEDYDEEIMFDYDYFIMIDMDNVCARPINVPALQKAIAMSEEWDAVSFNRPEYYDIFALSAHPYYYSCWHYAPEPRKVVEQMKEYITEELRQCHVVHGKHFYRCVSAFNGFGMYRAAAFEDIFYEWTMAKTLELMPAGWVETSMQATQQMTTAPPMSDDCEHRSFHIQAIQQREARICISPDMLFPESSRALVESDCWTVCSRGLLQSCDVRSLTPVSSIGRLHNYNTSPTEDGSTVYVCGTAVPHFVESVFPEIKSRIILVTGDCDINCPNDMFSSTEAFLAFIESDRVIHWYSQNCTGKHPKLSAIPIGMDFHTMTRASSWGPTPLTPVEQEQVLFAIKVRAEPMNKRKRMAYSNFHFAMKTRFAEDRRRAKQEVPESLVYYEPEPTAREATWRKQSEYAFVLSPHGNGLDCHRTWEALMLGCIPIVKTSPLDELFEGLPVWIVQEWSDVTAEAMQERIEKVSDAGDFSFSKFMSLAYWVQKIKSKAMQSK